MKEELLLLETDPGDLPRTQPSEVLIGEAEISWSIHTCPDPYITPCQHGCASQAATCLQGLPARWHSWPDPHS